MTRTFCAIACGSMMLACQRDAKPDPAPTDAEVLQELSRRSKVPPEELRGHLSDCDANQRNMYFCAYRDIVAAELVLNQRLVAKQSALPECRDDLAHEVSRWQAARDESCEKNAREEFGEGSMGPTARNTCIATETDRYSKLLGEIDGCNAIASLAR